MDNPFAPDASIRRKTKLVSETKTFNPDQARDDHGRWTGGGSSPYGMLMGQDDKPESAVERRIPLARDQPGTPHFIEQKIVKDEHDVGVLSSSGPHSPLPASIDGVPTVKGTGVLRSDTGLEMQAQDDARVNITAALADAHQQLSLADGYEKHLVAMTQDPTVDTTTGLPHMLLPNNALDNAYSDLTYHYRGAPPDHEVKQALSDYNARRENLTYNTIDPIPNNNQQNKAYVDNYQYALGDLHTVYDSMRALVTQVGTEQKATGTVRTKHFVPDSQRGTRHGA